MNRFARALSLSSRLLAAACAVAVGATTLPGCLQQCPEFETHRELVREQVPTSATLRGVTVFGSQAIAVGDGGVALLRDDAGQWREIASGTTADLHAVATSDGGGDVVLAVGAGGTVARFATSGLPVDVVDTGVDVDLVAVAYVGDVALAVGGGVILRSEDNGLTWVPVAVPAETAGLRAVAGLAGAGWYAVGDGGLVLSSVDEGATWTRVEVPVKNDLRAIAVNSGAAVEWTIAATDGTVLFGEGGSFEVIAPFEPIEALGLSRDGMWMVGAGGEVRQTSLDEWTGEGSGQFGRFAADREGARLLAVASEGVTLAVGEGGTVLRTEVSSEQTGSHICRSDIVEGRPFVVDEEVRTAEVVGRDDWCEDVAVAALPAATRARLAEAWARDGAYEHASVASFARFVLQLLAVGAPPELIMAGQAALADEVRHAQACFGLASAYAGTPVGPGPLAVHGALNGPCDLATVAAATAIEGCVNETIAALVASTAAEMADDPAVRSRLTAIAADERRHAALAWRTVAWALARGDAGVREAVVRAFALPPMLDEEAGEDGLEEHGRLSRRAREAVARVAWRDIIAPQAAALFGGTVVRSVAAHA